MKHSSIQVIGHIATENASDMLSDPRRFFNLDESAFLLHPKKKLVLCRKGAKNVYSINSGNDKECVTVLLGGNAAGEIPPPFIIHKYEKMPGQ